MGEAWAALHRYVASTPWGRDAGILPDLPDAASAAPASPASQAGRTRRRRRMATSGARAEWSADSDGGCRSPPTDSDDAAPAERVINETDDGGALDGGGAGAQGAGVAHLGRGKGDGSGEHGGGGDGGGGGAARGGVGGALSQKLRAAHGIVVAESEPSAWRDGAKHAGEVGSRSSARDRGGGAAGGMLGGGGGAAGPVVVRHGGHAVMRRTESTVEYTTRRTRFGSTASTNGHAVMQRIPDSTAEARAWLVYSRGSALPWWTRREANAPRQTWWTDCGGVSPEMGSQLGVYSL